MQYKTFVISLRRRPDRREKIKDLFIKNNIDFSFYDGIDGKDLIVTKEIEDLFRGNDFDEFGIIKECIYGANLTHMALLKECSQQSLPYIIFEDDVHTELISRCNFTIKDVMNKKDDFFTKNIYLILKKQYSINNAIIIPQLYWNSKYFQKERAIYLKISYYF